MLIFIASFSFFMTLLGGVFAIRFKDKLHLILGFSAGSIIGVALFDLIPEALAMSQNFWNIQIIMLAIAVGFAIYMILDRTLLHIVMMKTIIIVGVLVRGVFLSIVF